MLGPDTGTGAAMNQFAVVIRWDEVLKAHDNMLGKEKRTRVSIIKTVGWLYCIPLKEAKDAYEQAVAEGVLRVPIGERG